MSRYSELCTDYLKAVQQYRYYERECMDFAGSLVEGLRQYLDCPSDRIIFVPVLDEPEPNKEYFIAGAMKLGDDGFFHFGLRILIGMSSGNSLGPTAQFHLHFLLKQDNDTFIVKLEHYDEFRIKSIHLEGANPFYDFIFDLIRQTIKDDSTVHSNPEKLFGFKPNRNPGS